VWRLFSGSDVTTRTFHFQLTFLGRENRFAVPDTRPTILAKYTTHIVGNSRFLLPRSLSSIFSLSLGIPLPSLAPFKEAHVFETQQQCALVILSPCLCLLWSFW
jgi:hypothetical protein